MKTFLSSIDISALVHELRPKIIGSWVNNIYSIGKNRVILRFRKASENPFELVIELGKRFHVTKYQRKKPSSPNNKIQMLRKHIRDLPVKDFYQHKIDRIIVFKIAYKNGFYKLVIELFDEGNIILVSPGNKIHMAYNYRKMKDRDIHPGRAFNFPPSLDKNILTITSDDLESEVSVYSGKLISFLNVMMGLGPTYSKDVVKKAGIKAKNASDLDENEKKLLFEEIMSFQKIIQNQDYKYLEYLDDGEVVDISPIPLSRYDNLEIKEVNSFNEIIDDYFSIQEEEPELEEDKAEVSGKISKLQKILSKQEKHLLALISQEEKEKRKGDLLYANFASVDDLLSTIIGARKSGVEWENIIQKLVMGKEKGIAAATAYEKIDPKSKKIWLSFEDESAENKVEIELDFTLSLVENANLFYEKSKKARRKIPGAEQAISRTKKQIEESKDIEDVVEREEQAKQPIIKRQKRWYEKFHWFLCDKYTVVGGTDLKANERLLKTYLDDEDLFFHADVHGAPYVIVKDGQNKLTEQQLKDVAIFALNYSSLWKAKKLVGDVYYVLPNQVSLTPPSGQYLAKGSVMIYGEKNYFKNVEIAHAVGFVLYEQYAQIIGGPLQSVIDKSVYCVQVKPGDTQKGNLAKQIRQTFLKKCPEEDRYKLEALDINELIRFIPGDADIVD